MQGLALTMTDIYSRAVIRAEKAIIKHGRNCYLVSFVKSGVDYDPIIIETTTAIKLLQSRFTTNDIDGTLIRADDKKFLIGSLVPITKDMNIRDGSITYSIVNIEEVKPGPTVILYKIQARL